MKEISGDINCTKLLVTCCLLLKSVLGMSARTYATQAASLPHTGTTSFHFEISMNNKTIDNAYYNGRRLASVGGAQGRDFEKPQSSLGRFKGPDDGLQKASKSWVRRLQRLLTQPTTTCGRLVRVGGRSCVGAYDGSKLVCLDADVKLRPLHCLIYSFGVGNDFTFDEHMQDFGCEVHAFDHDDHHEIYDFRLGPSAFFHKSRIGVRSGYFRFCENTANGRRCEPAVRYQTMSDIQRSLGHDGRQVDYMKLDIEGEEWGVLQHVLDNTNVLDSVSQLSLEIHLDDLRQQKPETQRATIASYVKVLQGLASLGFQLVSYEENELNPRYEMVDGVELSLYAEVLYLRRKFTVRKLLIGA
ncbi:uncharacterized protein [Procambarus clarkii]|uniref:uncharacterized protein n=1 Tax=Procambarus clarkii TaxID=6728 RepID=UPI001E6759C9|nr:uncharacterized protein LOC123754410 [Procambarus clarkii]